MVLNFFSRIFVPITNYFIIDKLITVGDLHGSPIWKRILDIEKPDNQKTGVLFIADYLDSLRFGVTDQLNNFLDILRLKAIRLFGNHEYHYYQNDQKYSGYDVAMQAHMTHMLPQLIREGQLQMAFEWNGYLFTHAGVTKTWFEKNKIEGEYHRVADMLNDLLVYKPGCFGFTPGRTNNMFGDDEEQTPIWVRPISLCSDALDGFIHVVGHTQSDKVRGHYKTVPEYGKSYPQDVLIPKKDLGNVVVIDSLPNQYAIFTDEGMIVKNCPN